MTLHKTPIERDRPDELDKVLTWALQSGPGQAQPPACVWANIERKVRRQMAGQFGWYALVRLPIGIGRRMLHSLLSITIGYPDLSTSRQTMPFGGWADYAPVSLLCIVDQQMSILKLGWAT